MKVIKSPWLSVVIFIFHIQVSLEYDRLHSISESISSSDIVIGMHGSLLSLIVFARPTTLVIEVFPFKINPIRVTPFRTLAALRALNYVAVRLMTFGCERFY